MVGAFSVYGSGEQIFGADEQDPKGGCGPCPKNALWTSELLTCPGRQRLGLFPSLAATSKSLAQMNKSGDVV